MPDQAAASSDPAAPASEHDPGAPVHLAGFADCGAALVLERAGYRHVPPPLLCVTGLVVADAHGVSGAAGPVETFLFAPFHAADFGKFDPCAVGLVAVASAFDSSDCIRCLNRRGNARYWIDICKRY